MLKQTLKVKYARTTSLLSQGEKKNGHFLKVILILSTMNLILTVFSSPKSYNVPNRNLSIFIKCLRLGYMCF